MSDAILTAEECVHTPVAVGQKPFNDTVEMESFTIQVYAPTSVEFRKERRSDTMQKFLVEQSCWFAAEALKRYLCEREGIEIPEEEP